MKTKTIYICEFCDRQYRTSKEAYECEAKCLGLTTDEYKEYLDLLEEERRAFSEASCTNNDRTRKRRDNAVKSVIEFQEKHGFKDNR